MNQERLALIARLRENPARKAAVEELEDMRDVYLFRLATSIHNSAMPVDQRDLDYKRGFWRGAIWAYKALPNLKASELQAEVEKQLESR